jgi:hypothetical protein
MSAQIFQTPLPPVSQELSDLLNNISKRYGDPETQLQRETALSQYIARLEPHCRVMGRGHAHIPHDLIYPAALIYDAHKRIVETVYFRGDDTFPAREDPHYFHSSMNYEGAAREVYGSDCETI